MCVRSILMSASLQFFELQARFNSAKWLEKSASGSVVALEAVVIG
jgi:hypothetical protein